MTEPKKRERFPRYTRKLNGISIFKVETLSDVKQKLADLAAKDKITLTAYMQPFLKALANGEIKVRFELMLDNPQPSKPYLQTLKNQIEKNQVGE